MVVALGLGVSSRVWGLGRGLYKSVFDFSLEDETPAVPLTALPKKREIEIELFRRGKRVIQFPLLFNPEGFIYNFKKWNNFWLKNSMALLYGT